MPIIPNFTTFRHHFATTSAADPDGYETWPVALVRANGFDTGFLGIPRPITAFPLTISCNVFAVDGGAAFDWYLSQRTDEPALQYLTLVQASATQSGTVNLGLTNLCVTELGIPGATGPVNEDQLRGALTNCALYVQRRSDSAIQWVDILQYTLSNYG